MKISNRVEPDNLEHHELQLSIFVAITVIVMAVGMAVLMYPVVFSHQTPGDRTMRTAFWGFCALCVLLTIYLWDRHATIRRLRRDMGRMATTTQKLSIVVITIKFPADHSGPSETASALGDAAKVIARKMREQDSIYILAPACFGAVLPGVDLLNAERVCARLTEGLADAAGVSHRFHFDLQVVNYPAHASSATELQQAVSALASLDDSVRGMAEVLP